MVTVRASFAVIIGLEVTRDLLEAEIICKIMHYVDSIEHIHHRGITQYIRIGICIKWEIKNKICSSIRLIILRLTGIIETNTGGRSLREN